MSPKNARLKTNGDQNSRSAIWTDTTLGFLNGKFSIGIRYRGKFKVSFHVIGASFVAMAYVSRTWIRTCSTFRINIVAVGRTLPQILELDILLFENHLVIELLCPRRERRARMITVAFSNVFDVLSKSCKSEVARFYFGASFVAMACMSRILGLASTFLRSFNLLLNIVDKYENNTMV